MDNNSTLTYEMLMETMRKMPKPDRVYWIQSGSGPVLYQVRFPEWLEKKRKERPPYPWGTVIVGEDMWDELRRQLPEPPDFPEGIGLPVDFSSLKIIVMGVPERLLTLAQAVAEWGGYLVTENVGSERPLITNQEILKKKP